MSKHLRTWVLVSDSARARLFTVNEDETELLSAAMPGVVPPDFHPHARDVKSDRPGRAFSSASGGPRHALEPQHDYHKLEKHAFVASVAKALEHAATAREFDRLVLVAPPRTMGEFKSVLSERVQAVMQTIPKDLTKASAEKVWATAAQIVRRRPIEHIR